jgi:nitrous oxide reductase accessory protein NosL
MKKRLIFAAVIFFAATMTASAQEDIKRAPSCKYCGMDRQMFSHSRMLVTYEDGSSEGTCSLHCAALDMALNLDKAPTAIMAADYGTKKLIDAEKATWVIGGSVQGVMARNATWAFENKADAEKFIARSGGALAGFEQAIRQAYDEMYQDTKMIRENRKKKKLLEQKKQGS